MITRLSFGEIPPSARSSTASTRRCSLVSIAVILSPACPVLHACPVRLPALSLLKWSRFPPRIDLSDNFTGLHGLATLINCLTARCVASTSRHMSRNRVSATESRSYSGPNFSSSLFTHTLRQRGAIPRRGNCNLQVTAAHDRRRRKITVFRIIDTFASAPFPRAPDRPPCSSRPNRWRR